MNVGFGEYSIDVENDIATITGDAQQTEQLEMLWKAIDAMSKDAMADDTSKLQFEFQDWLRESSENLRLKVFSEQQRNFNSIFNTMTMELREGGVSNDSMEHLATYGAYQLALLVLLEVDGTVLGEGVQYLLDAQRKNPKLEVNLHCNDCGILISQHDGVLH